MNKILILKYEQGWTIFYREIKIGLLQRTKQNNDTKLNSQIWAKLDIYGFWDIAVESFFVHYCFWENIDEVMKKVGKIYMLLMNINFLQILYRSCTTQGQAEQIPPKGFEKRKILNFLGVFAWVGVIKISISLGFLSFLTRKHMLWEGFYHDLNTKMISLPP